MISQKVVPKYVNKASFGWTLVSHKHTIF